MANEKKRDAEITFKSLNPKAKISMALESGELIFNKRVMKSTAELSTKKLLDKYDEEPVAGVDFVTVPRNATVFVFEFQFVAGRASATHGLL